MKWTEEMVVRTLLNNPGYQEFLNEKGSMQETIAGVSVLFFYSGNIVEAFYNAPYDDKIDYSEANEFYHLALPFLRKEVTKQREKNLIK